MQRDRWILGISASHNGAACLLKNGQIFVAIQEERLCGIKRAAIQASLPSVAISYCLDVAGIGAGDLEAVCCCNASQRRLTNPRTDLSVNPQLCVEELGIPHFTITHHLGHALSVFGTSGFGDAAVLIVDGFGSPIDDLDPHEAEVMSEAIKGTYEAVSIYEALGMNLTPKLKYAGGWRGTTSDSLLVGAGAMQPFNSLGTMYSAVAEQIFGDGGEAGKVMGLAPYGKATIPIEEFLVVEGGHLRFTCDVIKRYPHMHKYPECKDDYYCLAASVQRALEYGLMHLVAQTREQSASDNLTYAGGVALNGIANERILREGGFKNFHIIPPAEDSGTAIGAAYYAALQLGYETVGSKLRRDSFGRSYGTKEIQSSIERCPYMVTHPSDSSVEAAVDLLCDGKIIGWFTGGSELGPRALGQRSILCDARLPRAKQILNSRVKYREDFRPFAPVVLLSEAEDWFELDNVPIESDFMLRVVPFRSEKRTLVPGVVHVDGTGRLQTVTPEDNGSYYLVVHSFYKRTGVPLLVNTSLNTRGEPVVETPEDALWCLLLSGLDACVFDDRIVSKDPRFMHPLDLIPIAVERGVTISPSPTSPREHLASWETAWGTKTMTVPMPLPSRYQKLIDILNSVDGVLTGWQLLDRVKKEHDQSFGPELFIGFLAQLRRMGLITMSSRQVPQLAPTSMQTA